MNKKKCSLNKHSNLNAICFCQNCNKYFCNKCKNLHFELFDNHVIFELKENEIFTNICPQKNHFKLEFFCKNHNILCCLACISKIKTENYGDHKDCDICLIKDIKEYKMKVLKDNNIYLKNFLENYEVQMSLEKIKKLSEEIIAKKDNLITKIQKIFTNIRNALNEKEDKLLSEIDEQFRNICINEDFIKKSEKFSNKLNTLLKKGELLEKENWEAYDNDKMNNLNSLINECLNIEKGINQIKEINEDIKKFYSNQNFEIDYEINEEDINDLISHIKSFGTIITYKKFDENFNIEQKIPEYELNYHSSNVLCLTLLKDGRLVSGARDNLIIIYNKTTYKPDIEINEHKDGITCLLVLNSGILASCSSDATIKLFKIKQNEYEILQTLTYHQKRVYKIIQTNNNELISCSEDPYVLFYNINKDNNLFEYKKLKIKTDGPCSSIIQTKNKEICLSQKNNNKLIFINIEDNKIKGSISDVSKRNSTDEWLIMINKNLLLVPGQNKFSIINVDVYKIIRIIEIQNSSWIFGNCLISENILLTGDRNYSIKQWKIEGDNLNLISVKENAHKGDINYLLNLGNGHFASGSDGGIVKIW